MNVAVGRDWESFELYAGKAYITMNDFEICFYCGLREKRREKTPITLESSEIILSRILVETYWEKATLMKPGTEMSKLLLEATVTVHAL